MEFIARFIAFLVMFLGGGFLACQMLFLAFFGGVMGGRSIDYKDPGTWFLFAMAAVGVAIAYCGCVISPFEMSVVGSCK